jgi:D-alanyl-D-alanine carboxypeptidase
MNQTVYRNASGLPNEEQITTARDQAMLGIAIQERFPRYYRYFATASFTYKGRAMRNHNHLLGRVEGVDGIKTGFTNASGFNLVTSVKRGERQIVAVVLGGRSSGQRDARMRSLIETHIAEASTRRTRVAQNAAATETPAASPPGTFPAPPPIIAAIAAAFAAPSASAAPLSSPAPQTAEAAAPVTTPSVGSDEPIKPVKVKTVTVKVAAAGSQAKAVAKPATAVPAAAKPAAAQAVAVAAAPAASEPKAAPKSEKRVEPRAGEAASAPAANTRSNLLSNAVAAAGSAIVPKAAASEAPAPVRPTSRGGWAVQIGAFEDEGEARQRLSAAQAKAAHLLGKADRYTERTVKGDKTYYRARFVGFDRDRAEAVCRQLKRSEMDCLALKF